MPTTKRLTVISANLQNPFFRPGRVNWAALEARLAAFARLAADTAADVLLLQEVGRRDGFRVDRWLAERLGLSGVYERANRAFGAEEGLAILSRYPPARPAVCMPAGGLWRRPALGAVVAAPVGEVAVYTAHLSLRPWRNRRQPAVLRAWVEATAGGRAAIIGGDFNAHETAPQIIDLRNEWIDAFRVANPAADGATHAMHLGPWAFNRRLDYLFLRAGEPNIRIVSCEHSSPLAADGLPFSDHRAVVARFEQLGP